MHFVRLSAEYGLVVRKAALVERGVAYSQLLTAMESTQPLDENDGLVSFGPHFGGEAADNLASRLVALGLVHVDDFFVFSGDFPAWCRFAAAIENSRAP